MPSHYQNDALLAAAADCDAVKLVVKHTFIEAHQNDEEGKSLTRQNSAPAIFYNAHDEVSKMFIVGGGKETTETPLLKGVFNIRTPSGSSVELDDVDARNRTSGVPSSPRKTDAKNASANSASGAAAGPCKVKASSSSQSDQLETRTTLMLRNLPEEFTQPKFIWLLNMEGFAGLYDFVYMPMNLTTQDNFGYAFVNLVNTAMAEWCMQHFQGFSHWTVPSAKRCDALWCDIQGRDACIKRYRNSPIMHKSIPIGCQPALFDSDGTRIPFPVATKRIKEPRIRRPHVPESLRAMASATASMASATSKAISKRMSKRSNE